MNLEERHVRRERRPTYVCTHKRVYTYIDKYMHRGRRHRTGPRASLARAIVGAGGSRESIDRLLSIVEPGVDSSATDCRGVLSVADFRQTKNLGWEGGRRPRELDGSWWRRCKIRLTRVHDRVSLTWNSVPTSQYHSTTAHHHLTSKYAS